MQQSIATTCQEAQVLLLPPHLCVLLVLWMEVVNGVLHDIARVHRFLERTRDRLQRYGSVNDTVVVDAASCACENLHLLMK